MKALVLLAAACLAPMTAHGQSATPTFRSASSATLESVSVNFRAASSAVATAGTLVIATPVGTIDGEVMIASIGVQPSSATITAPAGWILVRRINNAKTKNNANPNSLAVYRKVATGAEPGSYTWGVSGASFAAGGIQAFSNVDTVNPINVESGQATASALSHSTPSVSTTVANTLLVTSHAFSSAAGWTSPSGMTEGFDIATPAPPTSAGQSIAGNWVRQGATGATGLKTASASNDADIGNTHILALRPAPSLSIGLPAGAVANDVLIASIGVRPSSATIIPPVGWTLVRRINNANTNANSLAVYSKVASNAEPASYTWSVSGASFAVGGIQAFFNVDTVNPIDVENGQATASALSHSTPSVATTVTNTMVVTSHTFASSSSWTPPAGMTESFDQAAGTPSSSGHSIESNHAFQAVAGATGVRTATAAGDADAGNTHILALRPATPGPPPGSDPRALVGEWAGPVGLPIVAVHMHLLPDGAVLAWGHPSTPPLDGGAKARVWDPNLAQPVFQPVENPFVDVYCSGHSFLADGSLLVTGGHLGESIGSDATTVFDFRTRTWSNRPSMNAARGCPTNTTLANGEVLVVSGSIDSETNINTLPEIWNPATGWRPLSGAQLALPLYPWMHLAPNGQLFNSGPWQSTGYLDTSGTGSWTTVALTNFGDRQQYAGTSVMYEPGKVLIVGGNPTTATAEIIDLNAAVPQWQYTNPMAHPRRYLNAILLPDGKVLVTGGTSSGTSEASGAVFAAEMWDPATGAWSTLAAMSMQRIYQSTALLLPDGRVLTAGGRGSSLISDSDHYDAEYYSPPYLFKAPRPTISSAPENAAHGESFTVGTPEAADIAKVTLLGLSSTTHEFNQNQRFVPLAFTPTADSTGLSVTVPSNANIVPPGYYMLFILNGAGVPSVAHMLRIGEVTFFCTFANAPTDCGFGVQEKVPGRASIVNIGRDGATAVRLHTEPGDTGVAGSGSSERNDITLSQSETDCYEGREQWWAHSILFPDDYVVPPSGWGVAMDFHHTGTSGQANFHVDAAPNPVGLRLRGYGGATVDSGEYQVVLGPVVRNIWYDFVYHVKWSSGSDGFMHAWVNGVKKLDHSGPTLYAGMGCYLKLANYHPAFGQPSSVIHDRVIRGTTARAVSSGPLEGVAGW